MQLAPLGIGSAIDVTLSGFIDKIRKNRIETFFDELESGHIALTEELIRSEPFLHCYFS